MSVVAPAGTVAVARARSDTHGSFSDAVWSVAKITAAIAAVVVAGRYLLQSVSPPAGRTGAREVMTRRRCCSCSARGADGGRGMSMALGAFLAGVLLAESNYRHELEADIEPFRACCSRCLMGVGMSIDLSVGLRQSLAYHRRRPGDHGAEDRGGMGSFPSHLRLASRCPARRLGAQRGRENSPSCSFRSASRSARSRPRRATCSPRSRP